MSIFICGCVSKTVQFTKNGTELFFEEFLSLAPFLILNVLLQSNSIWRIQLILFCLGEDIESDILSFKKSEREEKNPVWKKGGKKCLWREQYIRLCWNFESLQQ